MGRPVGKGADYVYQKMLRRVKGNFFYNMGCKKSLDTSAMDVLQLFPKEPPGRFGGAANATDIAPAILRGSPCDRMWTGVQMRLQWAGKRSSIRVCFAAASSPAFGRSPEGEGEQKLC